MEETCGTARLLVGRIPIPLIVLLHGPWFLNGAANGAPNDVDFQDRVRIEGVGINAANAVIAQSLAVLDATREYYNLELLNATIIPSPIDVAEKEDRWQDDRCKAKTILFIGRFDRHKGGDLVIEAFGKLAMSDPEVELIFCGPDRGFIDDADQRWSLQEFVDSRIASTDGRARIEILGQQPPNRVRELRREAAVTIMASRFETFGYTVLEALSQGCPTVATSCGGPQEIVRDGETGLLVPPEDPTALANAIRRLLEDRELAARLGNAAWHDVKERFDPQKIAGRTADFYRQVIERWEQQSG